MSTTQDIPLYNAPLPRRLPAVRFPVLIFCASPTNSPMSLLYVSESCWRPSRICNRYVSKADAFAVCSLISARCDSTERSGSSDNSSVRCEHEQVQYKRSIGQTCGQVEERFHLRLVNLGPRPEPQLRGSQCPMFRCRRARLRRAASCAVERSSLQFADASARARWCRHWTCVDLEHRQRAICAGKNLIQVDRDPERDEMLPSNARSHPVHGLERGRRGW